MSESQLSNCNGSASCGSAFSVKMNPLDPIPAQLRKVDGIDKASGSSAINTNRYQDDRGGGDADAEAATRRLAALDLGGPNPELDNFLWRIDEISEIINGLACGDAKVQEKALRKADLLLRDNERDGGGKMADQSGGDGHAQRSPGSAYRITSDRTVINTKASSKEEGVGDRDMGQEAFMRMVEKDANERAKDRAQRKERSDEYRKAGNVAFRKQNWAEALDNYNKAIQLIKDSPCLYNNRALTYLRIGIYSKAIEDCDFAIYLAEGSMKAHLLKAKAYFLKEEPDKCRAWLDETRLKFPNNVKMIDEYQKELFELRFLEVEMRRKSNTKITGSSSDDNDNKGVGPYDSDEVWKKAARHEILTEDDNPFNQLLKSKSKQKQSTESE